MLRHVLSAGVSVVLLTSCELPWGEKAATPPPPETKLGAEAKCLAGIGPVITEFLDGTADPVRVSGIWTCFDDALGLFERKVRGENPQFYTGREVARFFEDHFLDENIKINDVLLTEIMRFKQLFAGGENGKMTREELGRLREFARKMRALSVELLPQMKVLSMNWAVTGDKNFEQDLENFENAKTISEAAILRLAEMIEPHNQRYELRNFVVFLEELQKVFDKKWTFTAKLQQLLPLIGRLKGALTGTQESVIQPKDWRMFGMLGIRTYFQYLRYYYFFENNPRSDQDPELILVFRSVDDLLQMVGDILTQKAIPLLDRAEIISILRAVADVYPKFTIPEAMVDELLKVKALLFGGSREELTPQDLSQARVKLSAFQTLAKLLTQYSVIFEGKWQPQTLPEIESRETFVKAEAAGEEFIRVLSPLLESSYDLKDFAKLLEAYEMTFPPKIGGEALAPKVIKYLPLIQKGKEIILANEGSIVEKADWPYLLNVLGAGYLRVLEFNYFLNGKSFFRSPGLPLYEAWVEGLAKLVGDVFMSRGRGVELAVDVSELNSAIRTMDKADLWFEALPASSVESLLPVIIRRVLTPPTQRAQGLMETSLGPVGLKNLMLEVRLFFAVQKKMDGLLNALPSVSHGKLQAAFAQNNTLGDKEVFRLISSSVPLALDNDGRLYLTLGSEIDYSPQSLNKLNLIRAGVRVIIRGYGDAASANKLHGIDRGEFERAFKDFKPALVDLGLIDADNVTFAGSRFIEGNLFTPYSDGDDFLDYTEGGSLAVLIFSGHTIYNQLRPTILQNCKVKGTTKQPYYGVDCSLEVMRRQAGTAFAAMPGMVQLFNKGSKAQNTAFLNEILKAAGWQPNESRISTLSDLSLAPHVVQYIESLFRRWDRDGNGLLDREEAIRAEPMFHNLLKQVSGLEDDDYIKAAFAFILVKGKPPQTFWEKIEFATSWVGKEDNWPIQADRYRIGQILGFIADAVRSGKPVDFKKAGK